MDGVDFLSLLVLFADVVFVIFAVSFLLEKLFSLHLLWVRYGKTLSKNAKVLAFLVAVVSMGGSLYLSEVKGFNPCTFCWYQRILMYPLTFILGSSIFWEGRDVAKYVLPLSTFGIIVSAYHYYMQVNPRPLAPCSSVGFSISCSERFFTHYGYITTPFMALTGFVLVTSFMLVLSKKLEV